MTLNLSPVNEVEAEVVSGAEVLLIEEKQHEKRLKILENLKVLDPNTSITLENFGIETRKLFESKI